MKQIFSLLIVILAFSCQTGTDSEKAVASTEKNPVMNLTYPETRTEEVKDDYHGTEVADPYRWLEIDTAAETGQWVAAQNKVTFDYLSKIPYREAIKARYEELFNYPKLSSPFKAGDYYFFYKNDGLQNQSVIYIQEGLEGEPSVFMDPNKLSDDGTVTVNLMGISKDNKYVAYSKSEAGSDWQQIRVKEVATGKELDDVCRWVKFSGASWWKDGFFYSRYPEPAEGTEYSADFKNHSVYYHKLGTDQSEDKLMFNSTDNPNYYHFGGVTEDEKYYIVYQAPGTDGYAVHYKDLEKDSEFVQLFEGYANKSNVVKHLDGKFLVITDIDAPNYRLVEIDLANPAKENWKEIIPESENLLSNVSTGGGKMFASYLENATTRRSCLKLRIIYM